MENLLSCILITISILSTECLVGDNLPSNSQHINDFIPDNKVCGINPSTDKIVNGEMADLGEFPWLALLEYNKPSGKGLHCGGVLISSRYVLTAAHCIRGLPINYRLVSVRLGEWNTKTDPDCDKSGECAPPLVTVLIESVVVHPKFDGPNQINDIALLRLRRDIEYTDFIQPICLPNINADVRRMNLVDTQLFVAGWGKTETNTSSDVLLKVTLPVVSTSGCKLKYAIMNVTVGPQQFCAGGNFGQDTCKGDSGGPLMMLHVENKQINWYVMGVVSFGPTPCGLEGWPGVYTRVGSYSKWIAQNILP